MIRDWNFEREAHSDRDTMVNSRMTAVAAFALDSDWPIAKRKGVANYVRKVLAPMTPGELALMMPTKLQELVEHAATDYDRFIARRVR